MYIVGRLFFVERRLASVIGVRVSLRTRNMAKVYFSSAKNFKISYRYMAGFLAY